MKKYCCKEHSPYGMMTDGPIYDNHLKAFNQKKERPAKVISRPSFYAKALKKD